MELSREQYRKFVETVFAGVWLLNSWRNPDEVIKQYSEILQYLFSFYERFDANDIIEYDEKYREYFPTRILEEKMLQYVEQYNEQTFTEELIAKMVKKEFAEKDGLLTVREKNRIEDQYEAAIREHGVSRLSMHWE